MVLRPDAQAALRRLVTAYRAVHAEAQAAADPIATTLDAMVGVGPVLALTLRAEIADIARFADGPALASYAGVVPRVEQSAGHVFHGRITRHGSPWLRWALVEAARHAMRQDPLGRWARRLTGRKGLAKARVAVARKLCDEVVATWRKG